MVAGGGRGAAARRPAGRRAHGRGGARRLRLAAPFDAPSTSSGVDDDVVLAALRTLTSAGVVVEVADDTFWFTHALVADAIEHQLLGREAPAARAQLRGRTRPPDGRLRRTRPSRHRRRPLRRSADDRPPGRARVPREGLDVPGAAAGRRRVGEARTIRSCSPSRPKRRGGWTSSRRPSAPPSAGRGWRSRQPSGSRRCGSSPASTGSRGTRRRALPPGRRWRRRPSRWPRPSSGGRPGGPRHDHMLARNAEPAVAWGELAQADAGRRRRCDRRACRGRGGSAMVGQPRAEATVAMAEALEHARRGPATPILLCRAINNCLELVAELRSLGVGALRAEMTEASRRSGVRQAGLKRQPAVGRRRRLPRRRPGRPPPGQRRGRAVVGWARR